MHEARRANLSMQLARQQRAQARQARRVLNRAGAPAASACAGQPAMGLSAMLAMGTVAAGPPATMPTSPAAPSSRYVMGRLT
eukprot:2934038-Pyramimonas_sp.AAC.1